MSKDASTTVPEVTADELRRALAQGDPAEVLDVRPREQYEGWHVPGSRHVGGYRALKAGKKDVYDDLSLSDNRPVVTVCGAGRTSRRAARKLREQGHEAYSLQGGLRAWSFAWNVAEARFSGATVVQVRRTGKGCLSYLVGNGEEALVIDPSLSPEVYQEQAREHGWRITGIADTHVHADHLSRARRLAEATGAALYLRGQGRVAFEHRSLTGGDSVEVGGQALTALHTPGHTPEHMTFRLGEEALFTGDTLFLGGVGRPDLGAGEDEGKRKARRLHRSLQRLTRLPGSAMVFPGHASEPVPFDGEILGAPLHEVRENIPALRRPEGRFANEILERVPPTPPNHEEIIARNERGDWPEKEDLADLEAGANRCAVG